MRGILLAGGSGSRLKPLTDAVNKQLLPVFDKPMFFYPLATLMLAGVKEVLIITRPEDQGAFRALVGNGAKWGMRIGFATQSKPRGIADAIRIGGSFVADEPFALVLGDNLLHGAHLGESLRNRFSHEYATIFTYEVANPSAYACLTVDEAGRPTGLIEKPSQPQSQLAVPGLYFLPPDAVEVARTLAPSARGELEITDVNRFYLTQERLRVVPLPRGTSWMDTGTPESLLDAGVYVRILQERQGLPIASMEEIARRNGWIDGNALA